MHFHANRHASVCLSVLVITGHYVTELTHHF
eukprot:SAG11_NODE_5697_length_1484_cov_1.190614_1_plen_30_part_10